MSDGYYVKTEMAEETLDEFKEKIAKRFTAIFYDLAKEVPIGTLNRMLIGTLFYDKEEYIYSDKDLQRWAAKYTDQVVTGKLKFTEDSLAAAGYTK